MTSSILSLSLMRTESDRIKSQTTFAQLSPVPDSDAYTVKVEKQTVRVRSDCFSPLAFML